MKIHKKTKNEQLRPKRQNETTDKKTKFVDNRPEAIRQRKLQEAANNSPQVQKARSYQEAANNSPQVQKARSYQEAANNSPQVRKAQAFQMKANEWGQNQKAIQKKESPVQMTEDQDIEPVFYGNKNENTWEQDKDEKSGKSITYNSKGEATTRMEYLQSLGKWEDYEIKEIENEGKKEFQVAMKGKRTVNNFIELVKKVETAYPNLETDEIIDGIRALAPGYNTNRWRLMLGKSEIATAITPVEDKLTQEDIDALQAMIEHGGNNENVERGIAKDNAGDYVAMGHVLTGVTAGINRNEKTDLTSGFWESAAGLVGVGEYVDNLYASTIAGDLGQSATVINNQKGVDANTKMIGDGTEATTAELFGDIDGFNIGHADKEAHDSFSTLLQNYYSSVEQDEKENRFQYFKNNGKDDLEDQTTRFAANYTYQENGKGGGLVSEIGTEAGYAVDQFNTWTDDQMKSPSIPATFDKKDGKLTADTGIWLVSDPSNYKATKKSKMDGSIKIQILEKGTKESFNADVVEKETYGWTKIMVIEGENQGKIGWVSNKFIQ